MTLRLRPGVSTADTAYGTVLLDERSGEYWQLNPTAALIVRRLSGGDDPATTATALSAEFDVSPGQALRDVTALLDQLRTAKLAQP
ncbi:lasso peptide biosynthesis PqqD family chaperone [Spirillospora albida]|uniref:lasso peptide biosynthesis PqqD family chaperone n=1 Tax=Spirillospora albida TaxID=58123 RepID=UPI0004C2210A|nr:lasso peptide biosynthesis PqqD family chaperone [Spirillospora albida]